jgi:hypothetical protein
VTHPLVGVVKLSGEFLPLSAKRRDFREQPPPVVLDVSISVP